ncbi:MAG: hypothetical protein L0228_06340 [Planctomycetes bacterium]|nr:hypothetical protein [Planctomycetota bacterium]
MPANRFNFQFRLWHLLAATTGLAILLAILRLSSAITITLLVSIFPAALTTLILKKPTWSWTKLTATLITFSLLWFLLYALSLGPAVKLTLAMGWKISLEIPYSPVIWLYNNTFLKEPIDWYVELWI